MIVEQFKFIDTNIFKMHIINLDGKIFYFHLIGNGNDKYYILDNLMTTTSRYQQLQTAP